MLKRLPDLFYNFSSRPLDSDYLLVKNIWRRAQILVEYKSQVTLFTEENVRDGERPEDIATRLYRNPFTTGLYLSSMILRMYMLSGLNLCNNYKIL